MITKTIKYENAYCAVLDVVGFSRMSLEKCNKVCDSFMNNERSQNNDLMFLFSDTLIIIFPPDKIDGKQIETCLSNVFKSALNDGFLLQGGLTKGNVIIKYDETNNPKMFFGDAFIKAHKYTTKFPISIFCEEEVKNELSFTSLKQFIFFNKTQNYFNFSEIIDLNLSLFSQTLRYYLNNANSEERITKYELIYKMFDETLNKTLNKV